MRFSERAYDTALVNIAHDLSTHLNVSGSRVILDLPQEALRILLTDPEDHRYRLSDHNWRLPGPIGSLSRKTRFPRLR